MKILLSAYPCLPNEGSESGIGWNWAKHRLCLDLGGPGRSVNDSCGKVFATTGLDENALVNNFAAFFQQRAEDPALLAALASSAKARSTRLSWTALVSQLYRVAFTPHDVRREEEFAP